MGGEAGEPSRAEGSEGSKSIPSTSFTEDEILELSGEDTLEAVKELVLRNRRIRSLESLPQRLCALEVLSLSHNQIAGLGGGGPCLRGLTHLNLNFNALEGLEGIQEASGLQALYLSNNKIRDLEPLGGLSQLRTLSLFRNCVPSLDSAIVVLGALSELKELDLDGNPCAREASYRHALVKALTLEVLDGDALTPLDETLADEHYAGDPLAGPPPPPSTVRVARMLAGSGIGAASSANEEPSTSGARPSTPPAGDSVPPLPRPSTALSRPATALSRPQAAGPATATDGGRPGTALFRDAFLNEHPILLEYIAQERVSTARASSARATSARAGSARSRGSSGRREEAPRSGRRKGGSFVQRLRTTAARMAAAEVLSTSEISPDEIIGANADVASDVVAFGAAIQADIVQSGASPQEVIRHLITVCEELQTDVNTLQAQVASAGPSAGGASLLSAPEAEKLAAEVERLHKDNLDLKRENANVAWLQDENRRLQRQLDRFMDRLKPSELDRISRG